MNATSFSLQSLPNGWTEVKVKDLSGICGFLGDGDWILSSDLETGKDVRLVQLADIGKGRFLNKSSKFISKKRSLELGCTYLLEGDVLISRMAEPVARACILPQLNHESITAVDVTILRVDKNYFDNRYVCLLFNSQLVNTQAEKLSSGTTRKRISRKNLETINVPIAPLQEQKRIAIKVEELFSSLEAGVKSLLKVRAQLKSYRQAVLQYAFEGKLTKGWRQDYNEKIKLSAAAIELPKEIEQSKLFKLPENWRWVKLSEIGSLDRGKSRHRPRDDKKLFGGKYPFVQTGDIKNSKGLVTNYSQTYNEVGLKQSKIWPVNTLCITIAANIADTALLGIPACFPDSIVGFIADESVCEVKYVNFFLKSVKDRLESYAPATAQKNINLGILRNLLLPLAPLYEQRKMVEQIERLFSIADEAENDSEMSLKKAPLLHQSILNKAFEGKVVPQNSTDDSALRIIEKIREERGKYEKKLC